MLFLKDPIVLVFLVLPLAYSQINISPSSKDPSYSEVFNTGSGGTSSSGASSSESDTGFTEDSETTASLPISHKYIFSLSTVKVNWFRARDLCEAFDLEFARITSESELKTFKDDYSAAKVTPGTMWIGGNDLATEGTFMWATLPSSPVLFTKWAPGEPNNNNKEEHCIQFQTDFNYGYGWNDNKCEFRSSFVCQKP